MNKSGIVNPKVDNEGIYILLLFLYAFGHKHRRDIWKRCATQLHISLLCDICNTSSVFVHVCASTLCSRLVSQIV